MKAVGTKGELKKLKTLKINSPRFNFFFNLAFVFVFLNLWDYFLNKTFFNGMILGLFMFLPALVLWFFNKFKGIVVLTLISIFEFMVMLIFVWEGFELSGINYSVKSLFWIPFLLVSALNAFWGLDIYSKRTKI